MFGGVHKIYEGHIGVYTRGGALLPASTEPGIHFMVPLVTAYHSVQITVQTDKVTNIPVIIQLWISL
jgi:regulator of protease activity HflC (stomatin/prohibitin superfamily)